jgi:dihydrofolate reductase
LPNRTHVVITRQPEYYYENVIVVTGLAEALACVPDGEDSFIIGGGEIYKLALPFVDKIELTRIHAQFEADTYFPELDSKEWQLTNKQYHPKDDKHLYDFTYETYESRI